MNQRTKLERLCRYIARLANPDCARRSLHTRKKTRSNPSDTSDEVLQSATSVRISGSSLLKRVLDIDIERCLHSGANMKNIAALLEPSAITPWKFNEI